MLRREERRVKREKRREKVKTNSYELILDEK